MIWVLLLFGAATLLELGICSSGWLWRARRWLAIATGLANLAAIALLALTSFNVLGLLICWIGLYRVLNSARLIKGRMHESYLKRSVLRTLAILTAIQLFLVTIWGVWSGLDWNFADYWLLLVLMQLLAAATLLATLVRRLIRTRWPLKMPVQNDNSLPTLTVAIPARNETGDLKDCLHSLLKSDYPKLEILVLDDCSQDKRTAQIIKDFAHDGVRFVEGDEPDESWQPKNRAYDQLARQASGDYIAFCGVDVRFEPGTLRQLMSSLLARRKQMLCVLPWREASGEKLALAQAMRYFWELAPPRRLFRRPPVLSTCWFIDKAALNKAGGFAACRRAIVPEAYFARQLVASDGYSFLRANQSLGLQSVKSTREQLATAVRVRYPQLHRRPENVCLLGLAELSTLILPPALLLGAPLLDLGASVWLICLLTTAVLAAVFASLVQATRTGTQLFGFLGLLVGAIYDIGLLHYSMWRYEFSSVEWKDRNICLPAMHVYPHLPALEDK